MEEKKKDNRHGRVSKKYNTSPDFIPEKLEEISTQFMINFIRTRNKISDAQWYVKLCSETTKSGKPISITRKRKEFAKRFFPNLVGMQSSKSKRKITSLDEAKSLLAEIKANQKNNLIGD